MATGAEKLSGRQNEVSKRLVFEIIFLLAKSKLLSSKSYPDQEGSPSYPRFRG
jgi:hypothetical protein